MALYKFRIIIIIIIIIIIQFTKLNKVRTYKVWSDDVQRTSKRKNKHEENQHHLKNHSSICLNLSVLLTKLRHIS